MPLTGSKRLIHKKTTPKKKRATKAKTPRWQGKRTVPRMVNEG